jgi:DNA-binding SARP family transcriptional activator
MQPIWQLRLLGGLQAQYGPQIPQRFQPGKRACLLGFLAYYVQQVHPQESLLKLFWPYADPDYGRHCLCQALSSLQHRLEPPGVPAGSVLRITLREVRLNPEAVRTDVAEFVQALQAAEAAAPGERLRHLQVAAELYGGPLLPDNVDHWARVERARLLNLHVRGLQQMATDYEACGDTQRALETALRTVSTAPLQQAAYRDVMRLYAAVGRPDEALRHYALLQTLLRRQRDVQPGAPLRAFARRLASQEN